MKIGYYVDSYLCCGGNRIIFEHCNRLTNKGHIVSVIVRSPEKDSRDWFKFNSFVKHIDAKNYAGDMDILVATFWSTLYDLLLNRLEAKQIFYFVQSDERRFSDDITIKHFASMTYGSKVKFITIARWLRDWLLNEFNQPSTTIGNGLNSEHFYPEHDIELMKDQGNIVLIEGSVEILYKGVRDGMQAMDDLDCKKWLVTTTPEDKIPEIEKMFFDKIWIKPNQKILRQVYSSADVLMKVSHFEGNPCTQMEAMACDTTLLTSDATGTDEHCLHGFNCWKIPIGNIGAMREALRILLLDTELRNKLRSNALKYAKENFSWDASINLLEKTFQNSLK